MVPDLPKLYISGPETKTWRRARPGGSASPVTGNRRYAGVEARGAVPEAARGSRGTTVIPRPGGPAVEEAELEGSANLLCPPNPARPGREQR